MKKILLSLLSLSLTTSVFSQETQESRRARRGEASFVATRDATTLSMVGWGFGIAIGIGALCALIEDSSSSTNNTPNSH